LAPAKYGVRATYQRRSLLRDGPGKDGFCDALVGARGLEVVIARLAQRKDLGCIRRIQTPAELADPDLGAVVRFGGAEVGLIQAIRKHNSVQIRYRVGVDPALLIVQVALAYPGAVITIAVKNIKDARRVARLLRAARIKTGVITSKDWSCEGVRVVVATFGELGWAAAHLHCVDLLIVLDGVAALGQVPRQFLTPSYTSVYFRVPRVVGLVPAGRHLALADRIGLVELFGPEEMRIPAHGWVERQVEVVPVTFKSGKACWDPQTVNRKRCNLWRHPRRNRLIARGARALVAGDRAGLLAAFPRLSDVHGLLLPARVIVAVESLEHAEALKAELPDWPIDEPAAGWVAYEIATFDGLRSRPLNDIDVLVRADGGTGLPPLAPFALTSPSSAPARPLVVVDVLDRNHPELRKAVHSREHAYIEAGWRPAGCDAVDYVLFTLFPERGRK
jgi:hypothetical protein